ncbi:M23 family metallopeptidase [Bacillus sp. FJAT-49711]|uniref:M23 family metallopeptidase n=1 Tax=Bacillus sp. FJAT-49711 TaxID=2833585 RepID=UPI001BCA5CB0|nr:M23 family metallopeptidase [Bacillus sp. FJAT-49711]MBS4216821.1 M23 family metallopeptidase [Bacillus sp. FJAT-49711]
MVLEGYKVTSGYGFIRDPFGGRQNVFHAGIDLVKEHKAPIYAFLEGTVVFGGFGQTGSGLGGYGNVVLIEDLNGYGHLYAHLDSVAVATGAHVSKGQMIGRQGATGQVTGSHLHYEIRRETSPSYGWSTDKASSTIDPIIYLQSLKEKDETTENKPSQHENIPPIQITKYQVKNETSGYVTAADAKAGKNKKTTVKPGLYFVYKTSGGMINVTTKNGTPGSWINPNEIGSATFKVSQKVKIKSNATKYSRSNVSIPRQYKNKYYTIQQVGNEDVLIKELYSWIKKVDLQ